MSALERKKNCTRCKGKKLFQLVYHVLDRIRSGTVAQIQRWSAVQRGVVLAHSILVKCSAARCGCKITKVWRCTKTNSWYNGLRSWYTISRYRAVWRGAMRHDEENCGARPSGVVSIPVQRGHSLFKYFNYWM